jgi:hypothetical protein
MTDTSTPEESGSTTPEERTLADWMRITQRSFMRRVAEEIGDADIDMRAAMAAKFHGHPSPEADKLAAAVKAVQDKATASVSADDLAATLRTLETIARELGWDESQASGPGRGFGPGFGPGFGRGPWGGGWGGWGFDPRRGFGRGHGHRGHKDGGDHPKREHAYERGFEAGFDAAQRRNPAA